MKITGDGSPTMYNEEYQEHYHSLSGAVEEAREKYIKPCRIEEKAKKGPVRILDIGFGLGYNAIAAIDAAHGQEIEVISLEKKLRDLQHLNPDLNHYHILKELSFDPLNNIYTYEDKDIYLKIYIGDARKTIMRIKGSFDAVFLDPFSPPKNPELWTVEFLREIAKRMKKDAILATYSCARSVRHNLKEAGFLVEDGPKVGRRGPSTLAKLYKSKNNTSS